MFSYEFWEIFKNAFFKRTLAADSEVYNYKSLKV